MDQFSGGGPRQMVVRVRLIREVWQKMWEPGSQSVSKTHQRTRNAPNPRISRNPILNTKDIDCRGYRISIQMHQPRISSPMNPSIQVSPVSGWCEVWVNGFPDVCRSSAFDHCWLWEERSFHAGGTVVRFTPTWSIVRACRIRP